MADTIVNIDFTGVNITVDGFPGSFTGSVEVDYTTSSIVTSSLVFTSLAAPPPFNVPIPLPVVSVSGGFTIAAESGTIPNLVFNLNYTGQTPTTLDSVEWNPRRPPPRNHPDDAYRQLHHRLLRGGDSDPHAARRRSHRDAFGRRRGRHRLGRIPARQMGRPSRHRLPQPFRAARRLADPHRRRRHRAEPALAGSACLSGAYDLRRSFRRDAGPCRPSRERGEHRAGRGRRDRLLARRTGKPRPAGRQQPRGRELHGDGEPRLLRRRRRDAFRLCGRRGPHL